MRDNIELNPDIEVMINRIRGILEEDAYFDNKGRATKKANVNIFSGMSDNINIVPSENIGVCHRLLVGVCFDGDNLENRLLEFLNHASLKCPGRNIELYFLTTKWNSDVINRHMGYIVALRRNGVDIKFVYITLQGVNVMNI